MTVAWSAYQQLRSAYATKSADGRPIAEKIIASFLTCPIPEVGLKPTSLRHRMMNDSVSSLYPAG